MVDVSKYTGLITSQHASAPRFMAMVAAVCQPLVDVQNVLESIPAHYDLDHAIGAQLDAVGAWVGISRQISTPLQQVYFSLDTPGLGFDQGSWKGPYDPDTGLISLDDDTYRLLIRAKIGANSWDGTLGSSAAILNSIFNGTGSNVFIQDNGDMTITIGVAGTAPSAVFKALLTGGYVPLKPATVHVNYAFASTSGTPLFGFDVQNQYIAGFDSGSFGVAS
ncbi:DUF2612 domain-containing protein [Chromobacterium subtsugae]|uniref:DUF2612 domain-containing protein n=1 Tax=Chromobacterium subtsugae TaxID=251747 RepID=UPI000641575C|nr:DUF2612 domain-containing protein [Chromobacterium subtsugae]